VRPHRLLQGVPGVCTGRANLASITPLTRIAKPDRLGWVGMGGTERCETGFSLAAPSIAVDGVERPRRTVAYPNSDERG
jgi:hypothetical protein